MSKSFTVAKYQLILEAGEHGLSLPPTLFEGMAILDGGAKQTLHYTDVMLANEPLEASQLLVSLSWRQYIMLRSKGFVWNNGHDWSNIVNVPYDSEVGLKLT